ncbi:MAG TPA: DUF4349 domain-containing protein [Blastocatellia bacterium]|nr:DUF4349 domain-containing protein [Blastocatellia bacterium]
MRLIIALLAVCSLALSGCNQASNREAQLSAQKAPQDQAAAAGLGQVFQPSSEGRGRSDASSVVPLSKVDAVHASTEAAQHKIIRNASLTIEIDSPSNTLGGLTEAAESQGGFVVTSESRQSDGRSQSVAALKVVIRVPSAKFYDALERVRRVGGRVINENISGQDVTEEFLDVEARIRTKKALEAQFLEIMKQARSVSDALEVQRELGEVRTEIEQLEGRRRFLENQASMSTITAMLQEPVPLVASNPVGFMGEVREAAGDGIDIAVSIVLGLVRLVIVMLPITLFILLPIGLFLRALFRWFVATRKREAVAVNAGGE